MPRLDRPSAALAVSEDVSEAASNATVEDELAELAVDLAVTVPRRAAFEGERRLESARAVLKRRLG